MENRGTGTLNLTEWENEIFEFAFKQFQENRHRKGAFPSPFTSAVMSFIEGWETARIREGEPIEPDRGSVWY